MGLARPSFFHRQPRLGFLEVARPGIFEWALQIAEVVATRGTCARRQVGCVLLDAKGRILATGYNGRARGLVHCLDLPCTGAKAPSGHALHQCEAIHAESNALLQCSAVDQIVLAAVTASPCLECVKLLMNTGCQTIVFRDPYPHPEAASLWTKSGSGRMWLHTPKNNSLQT